MAKLTIRDLNVRGKRVFLRVDYNVPLEEKDGQMVITDDTRIRENEDEKHARPFVSRSLGGGALCRAFSGSTGPYDFLRHQRR